ncbi:hypothetical protein AM1_A0068 (plasmid) [Acaryochloris marina MBIC11017]|uniref:Uncharacterized protein n=1 Tax=Acaryochloris marina (strain MBIC 11017) TaxID=329726 RepID=A8ZK77_ACAM1|nr:hypothetical protein AM1_A0068 [Acaryochloris marina MBIC11017]
MPRYGFEVIPKGGHCMVLEMRLWGAGKRRSKKQAKVGAA